jgi:hypothetical protein
MSKAARWKEAVVAADDQAIVVGISHYPALGDLAGPENDARDFAEWLKSETGGDVPEGNVCLILSSDFPMETDPLRARPTAEALILAIDKLYDLGNSHGGHAGRRLYVFMAGHGFAPDIEDTALLMANSARGRSGHHIRGRPYANWFRTSAFFDEVVLFMDCCRENYRFSPLQTCHLEIITSRRHVRYYYGMATDFSHATRERPDEKGVVRGVFTTALLTGLREGPPGGGNLTGSRLEDFVHNYLPTLVIGEECPEPKFSYERKHEIIFGRRDSPVFDVSIRVQSPNHGREVEMFDGSLQRLPPKVRIGDIWEWELGPGIYKYGYTGGPYEIRELIGEGREIDVQL